MRMLVMAAASLIAGLAFGVLVRDPAPTVAGAGTAPQVAEVPPTPDPRPAPPSPAAPPSR